MAVLFKLQMQFYTEEPGLYSCYHLFDLFVCMLLYQVWIVFAVFSIFSVTFFYTFEKRLYFILFATAKTKMKFYELKN